MPQQQIQQQPEQQHHHQGNLTGISNTTTANNSTYQSPQMPNLELDAYGSMVESMDVDNMVLDIPNRWTDDGMDDLDTFDFGVTEEDFDFFESSGPASAPAAAVPLASMPAQPPPNAMDATTTLTPHDPLLLMQEIKPEDMDITSDFDVTLMDLDQKQQQVILDTDLDSQPNDLSLTPLQVGIAQHDPFNTHSNDQDQKPSPLPLPPQPAAAAATAAASYDYHQQLFVPPQFAPIKIESVVNDAKYIQGGKFTYPAQDNQPLTKRKQSTDYRPDYVPVMRSSKKNKRKSSKLLLLDTINKENKPLELLDGMMMMMTQEIQPLHAKSSTTITSSSSSLENDDDDDQEDTSSSEHSSGSSTEEDDDDEEKEEQDEQEQEEAYEDHQGDYNDTNEDMSTKITRTMKSLSIAQSKFVGKLTRIDGTTSPLEAMKNKADVDQIMMDYDAPFARAVTDSVIRVAGARTEVNELEETKALDYLCQQAVLGGYPFSGGIEAMSSNGFEANEGESAKVVIARRRNLLQKYNGDTIHVPSTPSDVEFMNQNFKHVLSDIFYQQQRPGHSDLDAMCIDALPIPASVTVKGPLNVQDYYELSETNQAHSKYGKYQVKKRRPAEPNLGTLQPPSITVNRQGDMIEGTSKLIMFWEKLRLKPYSLKKQINYFVVYPRNESIENGITHFFKGLSTVYETCQLGTHHPAANIGPYRRGLVPVTLLPPLENESFHDRQLRSYMQECQHLGSVLGSAMPENVHIVIYMINPATHLASHLDLSRCFSKLKAAYNASSPMALGPRLSDQTRAARLVLQLVPIEHVLRSTSFGGCLKFGMKEIAFSVYSKCHVVVSRQPQANTTTTTTSKQDPHPVADVYAPPFVLSKPIPSQIHFKLKKAIHAFPSILESHAVLHMGYTFSLDKRWMIIVWTDNRGEMVEFAVLDNHRHQLPLTSVFEEAWRRTRQISKRTGFGWTFVICKMGLVFEEELTAWIACLPSNAHVAIVSLDVESTLYVNTTTTTTSTTSANADTTHDMHTPTDTLNTSTPTMMNSTAATTTKKMYSSDSQDTGHTKALLLNHRVAYSNKRERMAFGMLGLDSISKEDWMIPLASGYLIHTPPTTENPNNELFNCSPLVMEIHLVYNQTNHSAYSTLRDIIKKYHALSFVNVMPSNSNCFPLHLALVERLSRILLVVHS